MLTAVFDRVLTADRPLVAEGITGLFATESHVIAYAGAVHARLDLERSGTGLRVTEFDAMALGVRDADALAFGPELWTYTLGYGAGQITAARFDSAATLVSETVLELAPSFSALSTTQSSTRSLLSGFEAQTGRLHLYDITDSQSAPRALGSIADHGKTALGVVSDTALVHLDGQDFMIMASLTESGLSCYQLPEEGAPIFVDALFAQHGLWASGLQALEVMEQGGQAYVIAAASGSSSLAVVRVNPMGVMFVEDVLHDSQLTRFGGASHLASAELEGRSFIACGGSDGGVALLELLPGGQLYHHDSLAQSAAWDIGALGALEIQADGDSLHILASGAGQAGVARLTVSLETLGQRLSVGESAALTGSAQDDLILGDARANTLSGGAGNDLIFAGTGVDQIRGGKGADIFVFQGDGEGDVVQDFEHGTDRLDLSGWGRIYTHKDLTLTQTAHGAQISWREETLDLHSANGDPIATELWAAGDFIF